MKHPARNKKAVARMKRDSIRACRAAEKLFETIERECIFSKNDSENEMVHALQTYSDFFNLVDHFREIIADHALGLIEDNKIEVLPLIETSTCGNTLTDYAIGDESVYDEPIFHYSTQTVFDPSRTNSPFDFGRWLPEYQPRAKVEATDVSDLF